MAAPPAHRLRLWQDRSPDAADSEGDRTRRDLRAILGDGISFSLMVGMGETYLPAFVLALGMVEMGSYSNQLDNPANKRFVADFTKTYGYMPAEYGAQAYDTINLIDSAVRGVGGKIEDKKAFIAALEKADFHAVRGSFRFNTNHFGIQNFYMEQVEKGPDGKPYLKLGDIALKDHGDAYAQDCKMQ